MKAFNVVKIMIVKLNNVMRNVQTYNFSKNANIYTDLYDTNRNYYSESNKFYHQLLNIIANERKYYPGKVKCVRMTIQNFLNRYKVIGSDNKTKTNDAIFDVQRSGTIILYAARDYIRNTYGFDSGEIYCNYHLTKKELQGDGRYSIDCYIPKLKLICFIDPIASHNSKRRISDNRVDEYYIEHGYRNILRIANNKCDPVFNSELISFKGRFVSNDTTAVKKILDFILSQFYELEGHNNLKQNLNGDIKKIIDIMSSSVEYDLNYFLTDEERQSMYDYEETRQTIELF